MPDIKSDKIIPMPAEVRFDPEALSYAELKKINTVNMFERIPLVEKCITGWGYDVKFVKGSLRKLDLEDAGHVINVVLEGIGEDILEAAKHVEVDFKRGGWSIEQLEKLAELDEVQDWTGMGAMFLQVCTFAGGQPSLPLNAVQGGAAYKAIMDKWGKILSGKN